MDATIEPIKIDYEYLSRRPLSASTLKEFWKSPKHFIDYITQPSVPPTDAMILGKATECLSFYPEKFDKKFLPYNKPNLRTNAGKSEMESIITQAKQDKKLAIKVEQVEIAKVCADNVKKNEKIKPYIEGIKRQQVKLQWTDKSTGIPMIGYVDLDGDYKGHYAGEFKTTIDASGDGWIRQAYNLLYHIQVGTYSWGYHKMSYLFPNFFFILAETTPPYNSNIFFCDGKYISQARAEVVHLLQSFKYCMDNNLFHQGYEFWIQTMPYYSMKLPGYAKLKSYDTSKE